jgi:DNA polymerase elongation subunit (family B)
MRGPKILLLDIETAPIQAYVWSLWGNDVALNQIKKDWHVLSWAAKWLPSKNVVYHDQRNAKNIENDKQILKPLWQMMDDADIIVTQNGKKFDEKKLNSRFAIHGFPPPAPYKHIDTLAIAKKKFAFTSNKLEYLTEKLNKKYKKLKHEEFAGFELWRQCLAGNVKAWKAMEKYNKYDVLALEELYHTLVKWDNTVNFSVYYDEPTCSCGSTEFERRGFYYTGVGKYQRYKCVECGTWTRGRQNLIEDRPMTVKTK